MTSAFTFTDTLRNDTQTFPIWIFSTSWFLYTTLPLDHTNKHSISSTSPLTAETTKEFRTKVGANFNFRIRFVSWRSSFINPAALVSQSKISAMIRIQSSNASSLDSDVFYVKPLWREQSQTRKDTLELPNSTESTGSMGMEKTTKSSIASLGAPKSLLNRTWMSQQFPTAMGDTTLIFPPNCLTRTCNWLYYSILWLRFPQLSNGDANGSATPRWRASISGTIRHL